LFLEREMFHKKIAEKIKIHIVRSINFFFRKSCRSWDNVEKYGRGRQATDDNILRCMRFACWVTAARTHTHTHTHRICNTFFFHGNNGHANAPQCNVIRTLPVLRIRCRLIFQKPGSHLKILDARRVTRRQFHPDTPQTLDATVQKAIVPDSTQDLTSGPRRDQWSV
jgi:hypothetical protein